MIPTLDIADRPPAHDQVLHDQAEHDAALIARVRLATIGECQAWIRHAADAMERMARVKGVEAAMKAGAEQYRHVADMLELLRSPP